MVFFEDCPDLLTGENCDVTWYEAFSPGIEVLAYILLGVNVVVLFVSLFLFNRFRKEKVSGNNRGKSKFPRQLKTLIFTGNVLASVMHIGLFSSGLLLKFDVDDPRGTASVFFLTFGWGFAFPVAFFTTVLLQLLMAGPVQERRNSDNTRNILKANGLANVLTLRILVAEDLKTVFMYLGPVFFLWTIGWVLLGLGVFPSAVIAYRYFVGVFSVPLVVQGILLFVTVSNLTTVIDTIASSEALDESTKTKFMEIKKKMKLYRTVIGPMLSFNGVVCLVLAVSIIAHEKTVFLATNILFDFSLTLFGVMIVFLFQAPTKSTTKNEMDTGSARPNTMLHTKTAISV